MSQPYEIEWHGDEIMAALRGANLRGLILAGEHLLQVSSTLVPHEEGDLERSGEVTHDGRDTVAVSYDRPYAVKQHEDLSLRHDEGRQGKYLEQPMHTEQRTMARIIATAARKAVE